jgi:hypothetical protein
LVFLADFRVFKRHFAFAIKVGAFDFRAAFSLT